MLYHSFIGHDLERSNEKTTLHTLSYRRNKQVSYVIVKEKTKEMNSVGKNYLRLHQTNQHYRLSLLKLNETRTLVHHVQTASRRRAHQVNLCRKWF